MEINKADAETVLEKVSAIVEAYDVLKNPFSKRKYDVLIQNGNSSSKRINKHVSEKRLKKYDRTVKRINVKSNRKSTKLISASERRLDRMFNTGTVSHFFLELLDFILM